MKKLKLERKFDFSPHRVFEAFTIPEKMRVWWTGDTEFEIDLRIGGRYSIKRKEGEVTYIMTGEYLEIDKPNKLVYTYEMPDLSPNIDTIKIEIIPDKKGGSIMTFVQEGIDIDSELKELPEGTISESEKGWQQGFDLIRDAWEK
jgi:uncharacterized protein YndB with AHSA1/START domain